jgi:hypothetical protein
MVVDEDNAILFIRAIAVKIPSGSDGLFMERTEKGLFDIIGNGHVILDRVEAPKDNIE